MHPKLPVRPNAGSERERNSICRTFVHVAPCATDVHDVKHAIQKNADCPAQASPNGRIQVVTMLKLSPIPLCSDRFTPILPPLERQS